MLPRFFSRKTIISTSFITLMTLGLTACQTTNVQEAKFTNIEVVPMGAQMVDCQVKSPSHQYIVSAPATLRVHNNGEPLVFACQKQGYEAALVTVNPVQVRRNILHTLDAQISRAVGAEATIDGFYPDRVEIVMKPANGNLTPVAAEQEMQFMPVTHVDEPPATPLVETIQGATEQGATQGAIQGTAQDAAQNIWMPAPPHKPKAPPKKKMTAPKPQPKKPVEEAVIAPVDVPVDAPVETSVETPVGTPSVAPSVLDEQQETENELMQLLDDAAKTGNITPEAQTDAPADTQTENIQPQLNLPESDDAEILQFFESPEGNDTAAPAGL